MPQVDRETCIPGPQRVAPRPKAARAVANACASNPAAIVIPCHRVVRSDGGLGGYSGAGGLKTKTRLLKKEGALK